MPTRTQIHRGSDSRRGNCRNDKIDFRYRQVGTTDRGAKNDRPEGEEANENSPARYSFAKVRESFSGRNEFGSEKICQTDPRDRKTSDRSARETAPSPNAMENKITIRRCCCTQQQLSPDDY